MKFVLNEYHRNVSDEQLIADVKKTAQLLGKDSITGPEYTTHGKYHEETLRKRFGSWAAVMEKAGLNPIGHFYRLHLTDEVVVEELKRVAALYQKDTLLKKEYDKFGKISSSSLINKYGSWTNILKMAGMKLNINRFISDEDLFEEIERIWIQLGRQPTVVDFKKGLSKYNISTYINHFGSWRKALETFVDYINAEDEEETAADEPSQPAAKDEEGAEKKHRTARDINLRLRFLVLQRDNFKCCACGASPAKDPAVVLHVDHVIPWSKGGETVIDNLQTLCSKCNLGKGNLL